MADVQSAFTLDHLCPEGRYTSQPEVEAKGQVFHIRGDVCFDGSKVGNFARQLAYEHGSAVAFHEVLELAVAHRDHDVAKNHYKRAIQFYDRTPIRFVRLYAGGDGPWIWPTFGFDLVGLRLKQRLRKIALARGFTGLPDARELYVPDIISTSADRGARAIGAECLKELARLDGQDLPMILDLCAERHREFLRNAGIL